MKKFCDQCESINDIYIKEEERTYKIKGVEVSGKINISYCKVCDNEVYNRSEELKNDIILFDLYKKEMNLLTSKEIKNIRERYDVSQEGLSKLLGFGLKTITRYENGSIQDKTHERALRLIEDKDTFKRLYELYNDELNSLEKEKIEKALKIKEFDEQTVEAESVYKLDRLLSAYNHYQQYEEVIFKGEINHVS